MAKLKGYLVGAHAENKVRAGLQRSLQHNYDGEQMHGSRKPDFSVHDDAGDRVVFMESKARSGSKGQANKHDYQQTLENVENAAKMTSSQRLHIIAPGGKNFFNLKQQAAIQKHAKEHGASVRFWDPSKITQAIKEAKRLVKGANKAYSSNSRQAAPKARTGSLQVNLEKTQQATKAGPALSNAAKPNPRTLAVDRGARPQTTAKPSTGTRVTVSPKAPAATPVKGTPGPPRFGTSHS